MDYWDQLHELDVMDQLDAMEEDEARRRKRYRERNDPYTLDDIDFKNKYRFSKEYAMKITELIQADIEMDRRGKGIPARLQVLVALRVWARQEVQDDAADLHGLSQQSITNLCRRVATAIAQRAAQFIKMPTIEEQAAISQGFRQIAGFPNMIGAIDCTHIRIKKVTGDEAEFYINRKGFPSLNVQVVCDADLRIRDIVALLRGSTHDSRIFRESRVKELFEAGEFVGLLLGDGGYACTPYLFTPLLQPAGPKEKAYIRAHIETRNTVERCFGVWKQRFRCLLRGFSVSLENVKLYVVALAVLHNIAVDMKEEINGTVEIPSAREPVPVQPAANGHAARAVFIERKF